MEIFNRLPTTEELQPHIADILRMCDKIMREDNQKIVEIAFRVVFDLHKNFSLYLESHVPTFLDYAGEMFQQFENSRNW